MVSAAEKLITHWRSEGLPIGKGVPEHEVARFESSYGVIMPKDMREYLLAVNGMVQQGGADCDAEGFAFWPLDLIEPATKACSDNRVEGPAVESPNCYFVFVDYMQWSWAYAINLGEGCGEVLSVGTRSPAVVASSFTEFVDLYVANAAALYPMTDAKRP